MTRTCGVKCIFSLTKLYVLLQDHILIELDTTGLKPKHSKEQLVKEDDPVLVVHPNYVIDV